MASPLPLSGKPLLYAVSSFASLGVFLFVRLLAAVTYDQGVMSGIITGPYFRQYYQDPTSAQIGTVVAVLEVGAFVTSLLAGSLADSKGRRWVIAVGSLIFTFGGLIQTLAPSLWYLGAGRIVSGCGVGFLSMIIPVYQSEVSGKEERGLLGCAEFTGNIIGYASSVWIDYFCSYIPSAASFRVPLVIQCFIGALLFFGSFLLPESPRHLFSVHKPELGRAVLCQLRGLEAGEEMLEDEVREIEDVVAEEEKEPDRSYSAMWRRYRGRVMIAMSSQAGAQLNGINVISFYAARVFEQAGWVGRDAIFMVGINALVYILASLPPWYLVDRAGRRPILLSGAVAMAFFLFAVGYFMYIDVSFTPSAVVVCVIAFNAAFGMSWGPIPWLYPAEIMPLAFRAKGVSFSTATNWFFNWVVGEATPILQDLISWRLYPMHGFFCLCSFALVYFLYPETAGVSLEEMNLVFKDDLEEEDDDDEEEPEDDEEEGPSSRLPSGLTSRAHSPAPPESSTTAAGRFSWFRPGKRAKTSSIKYTALDGNGGNA